MNLPVHPDLFHYAQNTVSSFRAMEHKIQEDYCSKTSCLLGMSLQCLFSVSEVQKRSLTLTIACSSASQRRPLLRGKLGKPLCFNTGVMGQASSLFHGCCASVCKLPLPRKGA